MQIGVNPAPVRRVGKVTRSFWVAESAYPVCSGMHIAEELHAFRSGPSKLHGEAGIKRWPCHSRGDKLPHLQGRSPLDASPGNRPPDLPVPDPPWPPAQPQLCFQGTYFVKPASAADMSQFPL